MEVTTTNKGRGHVQPGHVQPVLLQTKGEDMYNQVLLVREKRTDRRGREKRIDERHRSKVYPIDRDCFHNFHILGSAQHSEPRPTEVFNFFSNILVRFQHCERVPQEEGIVLFPRPKESFYFLGRANFLKRVHRRYTISITSKYTHHRRTTTVTLCPTRIPVREKKVAWSKLLFVLLVVVVTPSF